MHLEFLEQGSYANLNKGWTGTTTTCESRGYGGVYAAKAVAICNAIESNITNKTPNDLHTSVNTATGFSNSNNFSIMARLPNGFYFCAGSGGGTTDKGTGTGGWVGSGCYGNP